MPANGNDFSQVTQAEQASPRPLMGILEPSKKKSAKSPHQTAILTAVPFVAPPAFGPASPLQAPVMAPLPAPGPVPVAPKGKRYLGVLALVIFILTLLSAGGLGLALCLTDRNPETPQAQRQDTQSDELQMPPEPVPKPKAPQAVQNPLPPDDKPARQDREPKPAPASPVVAQVPPPRPAAGLDQKKIDDAISRGVAYLKSNQNGTGSWGNQGHMVGYAALPGLTLLECGIPAKDQAVQRAATFVRGSVPKLTTTYELSLAILFLDRLGNPRDKALIQTMALRLVAGQTEAGGWTYHVPILPANEAGQLLIFLQKTRPTLPDPLAGKKPAQNPLGKSKDLTNPLPGKDPNLPNLIGKPNQDKQSNSLPKAEDGNPLNPLPKSGGTGKDGANKGLIAGSSGAGILPVNPDEPAVDPKKPGNPRPAAGKEPAKGPILPPNFRQFPALGQPGKGKGPAGKPVRDDNSNTQFALLALWTARRHDVPTERSLQFAYQRFVNSQDVDLGWGYQVSNPRGSSAMVGVGLLGLAMGHGSSADLPKDDSKIKNGLRAFAAHIGTPSATPQNLPMNNLYFLWTVERVAMLYNLPTIGGKDWYRWGAQILLVNQVGDGSWRSMDYPGASPTIDTCFALLFLKRSNLVQDLTDNLQLQMAITDPDSKK
jgi:hypothetical protein